MTVKFFPESLRWVAMCDVLGFREMLRHSPIGLIAERYDGLVQAARTATRSHGFDIENIYADSFTVVPAPVGQVVFSDSILLCSRPVAIHDPNRDDTQTFSTVAAAAGLVLAVREMIQVSIMHEMPLRVGVAFGPCVVDQERGIHVGPAIIDAFDAEQAQEWIGGACHSSCLSAPGFDALRAPGPLVRYAVPAKTRQLDWAINWPETANASVEPILRAGAGRVAEERYRRKWTNAVEFFDATNVTARLKR